MPKTAELTGALLDYYVAKAEGYKPWFQAIAPGARQNCTIGVRHEDGAVTARFYQPTTNWAQGGPLIEKYEIDLDKISGEWFAIGPKGQAVAATPQEAICRAVVRAAFGDEVPEVVS